jgi:hypothetical protein
MNTEAFKNVVTSKKGLVVLASSMSLVGGAALGAAIAMKKLEAKYAEISRIEIEQAKEYYSKLNKIGIFSTPEEAVQALIPETVHEAAKALTQYQGIEPAVDPDMVEVATNVFAKRKERVEFDYATEMQRRDPKRPYLITKDEFFENEPENEQSTITYYAGDGVLADERDQQVPDTDMLINDENLMRFGEGSDDENIVYVRNNQLGVDYEICHSEGKFSVEVEGFIEHGNRSRPKLRRFRESDD